MDPHHFDLFVLFAEGDREWVHGYLFDALDAARVSYIHSETIDNGRASLEAIEKSIALCRRILIVISHAYRASALNEFADLLAQTLAVENETYSVIPLILRPVALPPRLQMLSSLDATNPSTWESTLARLCVEIQHSVPPILPKPICPYPGLVPFQAWDADKFYGRDRDIAALLKRLQTESLIFVVGPSGCGKSSFVFAGVVPELEKDSRANWDIVSMRPGETPCTTLEQVLGDSLDAHMAQGIGAYGRRLILYIDQFDELFTQGQTEERLQFIAKLQELEQLPQVRIIATVRADFFSDLMDCPLWRETAQFNLVPLRGEAMREAITKPAEKMRVYTDDGLVERLLADAADEPGSLPALQETMRLLWERMVRRLLRLDTYRELGANNQSGLATALAIHADTVFAGMRPLQIAITRQIFLRLVQFGEGRPDTRRQESVTNLVAHSSDSQLLEETLDYLASHRLLTLSGDSQKGDRRVDIAHEALFTGWPVLAQWIADGRKAELVRRRLDSQAAEWERLGRGKGGLLDEIELREAAAWFNSPAAEILGYDDRLVQWIDASHVNLNNQKKRQRRTTLFIRTAIGIVALLVITILVIFGLSQNQIAEQQHQAALTAEAFGQEQQRLAAAEVAARGTAVAEQNRAETEVKARSTAQAVAEERRQEAERQRAAAQARALASQSALILSQNPNQSAVSLLLAIESMERSPSFEGDQALRQSLNLMPQRIVQKQVQPQYEGDYALDINSLAFTSDGTHLAAGTQGGNVIVWNTSTWNEAWHAGFGGDGIVPAVRCLAFSPDNILLLAGTDDGVFVYYTATGKELLHLNQGMQVFSAGFSPDGEMIASASDSGTRISSVQTGETILDLAEGFDLIRFAPNSKLAAVAGSESVEIWDIKSAKKVSSQRVFEKTDPYEQQAISVIAFSPDSSTVAGAAGDSNGGFTVPRNPAIGTILVWNALTGKTVATMHHDDSVTSLAFGSDGTRLLSSSYDRTARVWQVSTGQELARFLHGDFVTQTLWTNSDRAAMSASNDSTARIWDTTTGEELARIFTESKGAVTAIAATRAGDLFGVGDDKGVLQVWSADEQLMRHPNHQGAISSIAFRSNGNQMVTSSWDKTARVRDMQTGNEISRIEHAGRALDAVFSPDGKYVASASTSGAKVWNSTTGKQVANILPDQLIGSLAFSPDGKWLAGGSGSPSRDGWFIKIGPPFHKQPEQVILLSTSDWTEAKRFQHDWAISSLDFSPDSRYLISGSDDYTARVWDIAKNTEVARMSHNERVNLVRYSPDGKLVASAESYYPIFGNPPGEPQMILWDPLTGKAQWRTQLPEQWISDIAFSLDNKYLAVANSVVETSCETNQTCQNIVVVFDVSSGKIVKSIPHEDVITTIFFGRDARLLFSASLDKSLRIWNLSNNAEISRITSRYQIWTSVLTPDGKQVAFAGSTDNDANASVQFAYFNPPDLVSAACARATRNLTTDEWTRFFGNEPYRRTCTNLPTP